MKEVLDVLSNVSGVPRAEMDGILVQVKANHARLAACVLPHKFEPCEQRGTLVHRYRCALCAGEVDMMAQHWYERGLRDGAKVSAGAAVTP